VSQAYLSRPNGTGFDSRLRFRSVFCDFVDIADDNELYSDPDCRALNIAPAILHRSVLQAPRFLDSQTAVDS